MKERRSLINNGLSRRTSGLDKLVRLELVMMGEGPDSSPFRSVVSVTDVVAESTRNEVVEGESNWKRRDDILQEKTPMNTF